MRIVFMGTPEYAAPTLKALVRAGHEVALTVTQPDRVRGRGNRSAPSPVKSAALELGLAVSSPESLCEVGAMDALRGSAPEAVVVVAYGELLRAEVLCLPPYQCINGHASLLPKYRGAAPIPYAIMNGDAVTGVTAMLMDEGLDTGPMLLAREIPIAADDTCGSLSARLAELTAEVMVETLAGLEAGTITPAPQDHALATLAPKIAKDHGRIDFRMTAAEIERRVRAFDPWPGASFTLGQNTVKVWRAEPRPASSARPGTIIRADKTGILLACRDSALLVTSLQPPGKKRMTAADFLSGHKLPAGGTHG